MRTGQTIWTETGGWRPDVSSSPLRASAQLVLAFGTPSVLKKKGLMEEVRSMYPQAHLLGCSTAGEICGTRVLDDSLVLTSVQFERSRIQGRQIQLEKVNNNYQAGEQLAQSLDRNGLVHVFVLSDGLKVNGSDLARGLEEHLPEGVTVTGGLAGDGERFEETLVFWDAPPSRDAIAVMGLYGEHLKVGCGSMGGWDPFGPERLITRSEGNVLYELDGRSALGLYREYLGEYADGLPATGLLFPLSIRTKEGEQGLVRTILSINEEARSMVFAGDMPEGAYARLMKANFDRLIDGAVGAAKACHESIGSIYPDLAILISCVGRKLVLKQRTEEEVEGVREILGGQAAMTGFYSYGEISPFGSRARCELHNQTMTITALSEK